MYNEYDEKSYDFQEEDYDSSSVSVDNDDSIASVMELNKGNFKIDMGAISISDIVIPTPIKDSRKETYLGLMRSVEELGVLVPIQVMVSEGFAEYVEEEGTEEGYEGPKYVLLDGLRRIFALKKNGLDRVNAVIYDFDDKDKLSHHVMLKENGRVVAYSRIVPKGIGYDYTSIGRVLVLESHRRKGIAQKMMEACLEFIKNDLDQSIVVLSAQLYVKDLYESVGFKVISDVYDEVSIPHVKMKVEL